MINTQSGHFNSLQTNMTGWALDNNIAKDCVSESKRGKTHICDLEEDCDEWNECESIPQRMVQNI